MKKLILLFLLIITSVTFAQKDEVYGIQKVTVSLLGYRQAVPSNIFQKNLIIDNTAGSYTVYFCIKQNGIVDTVNSIPVAAGVEKTFFNFTSDTVYVKGTSGQSVDIYILKGTGRGVLKSPGTSSNSGNYSDSLKRFVQYTDSTTKYSTPTTVKATYSPLSDSTRYKLRNDSTNYTGYTTRAQLNTALASYYTITQAESKFLHSADTLKYLYKSDTTVILPTLTAANTFTSNQKVPKLAVNQSGINPIPYVGVAIAVGDTNLYGLNVVGTNNTVRSSQTQSVDTSSISFGLTQWTKKPLVNVTSPSGTNVFKIDSTAIATFGGAVTTGGSVTIPNASFLTWSSRGSLGASADGTYTLSNNAGTAFNSFTLGGGAITAGFFRGTTDTDITGWFVRTPNGTLKYCWIDDAGTLQTSSSIP